MNEQVSFTLRGRNPDVLTGIANWSKGKLAQPDWQASALVGDLNLIAACATPVCVRG
jgi:hypothetical protein